MRATKNPARIVVIDDNPADVVLLRHMLDELNDPYELLVLKDGEEALQFVERHRMGSAESDPCVIVLDLHLPKYDGLAVLRAIKRTPELAHIQVVILATMASPAEEREMLRIGVRLYQAKPMNLEGLAAVAKEILDICKEPALAAA